MIRLLHLGSLNIVNALARCWLVIFPWYWGVSIIVSAQKG